MTTNAEVDEIEVARSDLEPDYIRRRIADWKKRVDSIFDQIRGWAAGHGATVEEMPASEMNEDLLRRHGMKPYMMSSLVVRKDKHIIKVIPSGLWTIGGNGRIDLVTTSGLYALVDFAEPFATPEWKIYGPGRREGARFSEDAFFGLV
jgi:hypothetical protein